MLLTYDFDIQIDVFTGTYLNEKRADNISVIRKTLHIQKAHILWL